MFRDILAAAGRLIHALDRNTAAINRLYGEEERLMSVFDNLKAAVAAQTSVDASAATLIQGIADKLKNLPAGASEADFQSLADELTAASAPLSAAVTANTPADPAPAAPASGDPTPVAPVTPAAPTS